MIATIKNGIHKGTFAIAAATIRTASMMPTTFSQSIRYLRDFYSYYTKVMIDSNTLVCYPLAKRLGVGYGAKGTIKRGSNQIGS